MTQFKFGGDKLKMITQDDPDFLIVDGMVLTPRAGFEINRDCPSEYRKILATCLDKGWIRPIAYIKESEYVWEKLQ